MSSRASRPRSRRRLVGVSAVAVGALLSTYAGSLRTFSYVRAEPINALAGCSAGATEVATDDSLQEAITNSVDGSVICITADITVSQTLQIDDTSLTLEAADVYELSGGGTRKIIDADFTDNTSDDTLTLRNLILVQGRSSTSGGAVSVEGGDRSDAVVVTGSTLAFNYSESDAGGLLAENLASVQIVSSTFNDDSVANAAGGDISGGALVVRDVVETTITSATFRDNYSVEWGGAVYLSDSGITTITGSLFEGNESATEAGGAIEIDIDDSTLYGPVSIYNSSFINNTATEGYAGGVRVTDNDDTVTVQNVLFEGNTAGEGGGGLYISYQSGPVSLSGLRLYGNSAAGNGGGLYVFDSEETLSLTGVTSDGNSAQGDGGSIRIRLANDMNLSNSTFQDDSAYDGGAVYIRLTGTLNVDNVTMKDNFANDDGAALYVRSTDANPSSATITIEDSTFTNNEGLGADSEGGAVSINYAYKLVVRDTYFLSNDSGYSGGGLYASDLATVSLEGTDFVSNQADDDGGALVVIDTQMLVVDDCEFRGNSAADDGGGAWLSMDALTMTTSIFADNIAGDYGGGASIYSVSAGLEIFDATFSGNSAVSGAGGVYAEFAGQADITNSTFVGNSHSDPSKPGAGGLWLDGAAGQATLDFLTVVGNTTVSQGGGLYLSDLEALVTNSIVAGNTAGGIGADVYLGYSFDGSGVLATLDDSYSLFTSSGSVDRDDSAGPFTFTPGPGTIFGAPKLNGLADNGGPTLTMLPQWDSPAFQAGDPNWTAPPANDQRGAGFPRDAGGRVSMGAIQGRSAKPAPPPAVPASPPREVQATAGDREVLVSWTAPASTGTFPITAYQVDDSTGANSCLLNVAPGDPLSCVIEDLTNGSAYSFRVRALTGAGWGAWSDFTADVTPEPGPSIVITGTREGKFAAVAGVTTGLVGETLIPRLRFPGPHPYKDGEARPVVDDAGNFTWQRRTRKKVYVYFFTEDRELRSNRVIIRPRG